MTDTGHVRRIGSLALGGLLVLALIVFISSCRSLDLTVEGGSEGVSTRLILRDSSGAATTRFVMGDTVTFVLRIENLSDQEKTFPLDDAQRFDFFVRDSSGRELWRWSHDQVFVQVGGGLSLAPRQTIELTTTWHQTDNREQPIPRGRYTAEGLVPTDRPGPVSDESGLMID